jgi:hypothetical protein
MNLEVIKASMKGIQREINLCNWELSKIVNCFLGKETPIRFLNRGSVDRGLFLHRRMKRLRVIKAELNLIFNLYKQ